MNSKYFKKNFKLIITLTTFFCFFQKAYPQEQSFNNEVSTPSDIMGKIKNYVVSGKTITGILRAKGSEDLAIKLTDWITWIFNQPYFTTGFLKTSQENTGEFFKKIRY